ncbi:extracellular solute-binding protein [Streptomyces sp. NPDC087440]|uniref:extracellular solute-binding protein n=1 Tax=Streptomyces sp. NPDC087440 TaxID=3365790 RepID=UPI0037F30FEB
MRRRQLITLATALVAATALTATGCGRSDTGKDDKAKDVAAGAAKGEITVWAMGGEGDNLPKLAAEFEKANPGTKIKVTAIPWSAAHDKLAGAIAANKTPDISLVGTTWMAEFAKTGALDPVPAIVDQKKFFPASVEPMTVNNQMYAVPWYVDVRALYGHNKILAKAGITKAPETWEELKASAKAAQTKGGAKWGLFIPPGGLGSGQVLLPLIWQQGSDIMDADHKKFTLDTPENVKALTYYKSFFEEKIAPKAFAEGDPERWFTKDQLAYYINGPYMVTQFAKLGGAGFEKEFTVSQVAGAAKRTSFAGGAGLAVFKSAKNRDASWKFVNWLTEPKVQSTWYDIQKDLPSVPTAWESGPLKENPNNAAFGKQMTDAKAPPAIQTFEEVNKMIEATVEKVVKGGLSPADAAKEMQKKADGIGTGA